MKKIITAITLLFFCAYQSNAQEAKADVVKNLLTGVLDLPNINSQSPITSVNETAKSKAAKTIVITKDNIGSALADAKSFKTGIITVGNHTVVKVTDFSKCRQSGSWAACMPYGEGFVQKGSMQSMKDYLNNIIGKPDDQVRTLYLFN